MCGLSMYSLQTTAGQQAYRSDICSLDRIVQALSNLHMGNHAWAACAYPFMQCVEFQLDWTQGAGSSEDEGPKKASDASRPPSRTESADMRFVEHEVETSSEASGMRLLCLSLHYDKLCFMALDLLQSGLLLAVYHLLSAIPANVRQEICHMFRTFLICSPPRATKRHASCSIYLTHG